MIKDEPIIYIPTDDDPTMTAPEDPTTSTKKQYKYTTSDTKYILPSDFCNVHSFVEIIPTTPLPEIEPPTTIPTPTIPPNAIGPSLIH